MKAITKLNPAINPQTGEHLVYNKKAIVEIIGFEENYEWILISIGTSSIRTKSTELSKIVGRYSVPTEDSQMLLYKDLPFCQEHWQHILDNSLLGEEVEVEIVQKELKLS